MKTEDEYFIDWESHVFGYGYGTGEEYTLPALKVFFSTIGEADRPNSYHHRKLEEALTPTVAWLMINILCHADILEYGTSPRFGWLTPHGERLKTFVDGKTADELYNVWADAGELSNCSPTACNCGPHGYEEGRKCGNPFWKEPA